jgi:NAD(P)-dependent dehydrogenase (short-subunit alcohol dehydrogenase family)
MLTNVNQRGTFLCTREEIRAMKKQTPKDVKGLTATISNFERGSIVNVSSVAAVKPLPDCSSYNPTTWARNGITKSAGK